MMSETVKNTVMKLRKKTVVKTKETNNKRRKKEEKTKLKTS
jgi:hypothetical protein